MTFVAAVALLVASPAFGPHPVGLQTFLVTDAARPLEGKPRPIQITLWYPAKAGAGGQPVRYRDLVGLAAGERGPATPEQVAAAVDEHAAFLRGAARLGPAEVERYLEQPLRARHDAPPIAGALPLVLVGQGNGGGPADLADLCELLASRGLLVATSPSPTRLSGPMKSEAEIAQLAEEQALDLAQVARALRARSSPAVARGPAALVAHSFGARAALLYAMRQGAAALVSLDGGIGARTGRARLAASRFFAPARAELPILHLYEEQDDFMAQDPALLQSLARADRWLARAAHLHHVHFTFVGGAVAAFPALAQATGADGQTQAAHEAVGRATAGFVQLALQQGGLEPGAVDALLKAEAPVITVTAKLPAAR